MSQTHPYKELENTPEWKALAQGVADLVKNGDMDEQTARSHIVGYLTQMVRNCGTTVQETRVTDKPPTHPARFKFPARKRLKMSVAKRVLRSRKSVAL